MSARLVLLTGPAGGQVASVLRLGTPLDPNDHAINAVDGHWWDQVRAWGGEVWDCTREEAKGRGPGCSDPPLACYIRVNNDQGGPVFVGRTWPDAVRAALGEVAPC